MNNTHLLSRLHSFSLRGFVVVMFAFFSTMAFAQVDLTILVDAPTAVDRLSSHYPIVQADFNATSPNDPNYALAAARLELTLHVYEDTQLGIDPELTLRTRFDEGMGAPPPQGGRPSLDEASGAGSNPPLAEYDSLVAELANLLKQ